MSEVNHTEKSGDSSNPVTLVLSSNRRFHSDPELTQQITQSHSHTHSHYFHSNSHHSNHKHEIQPMRRSLSNAELMSPKYHHEHEHEHERDHEPDHECYHEHDHDHYNHHHHHHHHHSKHKEKEEKHDRSTMKSPITVDDPSSFSPSGSRHHRRSSCPGSPPSGSSRSHSHHHHSLGSSKEESKESLSSPEIGRESSHSHSSQPNSSRSHHSNHSHHHTSPEPPPDLFTDQSLSPPLVHNKKSKVVVLSSESHRHHHHHHHHHDHANSHNYHKSPSPISHQPPSADRTVSPSNRLNSSCPYTVRDFKKLRLLGRGDVGRVYLVELLSDKEKDDKMKTSYAMKILPLKEMIARNKVKRVQTEREILCTTNHPFIVTMQWSFQTSNCIYFIMDYCAGGEFFRALQRQPGKCLPEESAKFYAAEVLLALEYLHMMGFIYRDLKPENILLHPTGHIVLTDFDLSKQAAINPSLKVIKSMFSQDKIDTRPSIVTNSFVGTEEYIAPEVITGYGHTSSVDWWTFGILLYEMLYGNTPFRGKSREETFSHILHAGIQFPEHRYPIGKHCKDLVRKLLAVEPSRRLGTQHGAADVKAHPWFKGIQWSLIRHHVPPIVPQLSDSFDTRYFPPLKDEFDDCLE